jgi:peptide/nickel transport system substrate-binding protein
MRRFGLLLLVAVSLLGVAASAATRPRYGGTLRVTSWIAPISLDPAAPGPPESIAWRSISRSLFDSLVTLDDRGRLHPGLALSWQSEPGNQRWQFQIRAGVKFSDGTPVTPDAIAASLRAANPKWKVFAAGESVIIECDQVDPKLPAELTLTRYGIVKRDGVKLAGSGPFVSIRWDPGRRLALAAREDYWGGRAFVDIIDIDMGQGFREQLLALETGQAEVVEIAPEQARRVASENHHVESSSPVELMALVFDRDPQSADNARLRLALALSLDRIAMNEVLLQGGGEPAGGLLPNWMTGYAFLFPTVADLTRAQQLRTEFRQTGALTLGYDAGDPLGRVVAERVMLNARDAGISMHLTDSSTADVQLVRLPLISVDVQISLSALAARIGLPQPKFAGSSASDSYAAESALLRTEGVIPVLYLRSAVALSPNVHNWEATRNGSWQLPDVWLATEKQ